MKYLAIVTDTWRESWARKTSIVVGIIVVMILVMFGVGFQISPSEATPGEVHIGFFSAPSSSGDGFALPSFPLELIASVSAILTLGTLSPWGIFLGIFIAATLFVPIFQSQRLYWILAKPLSRVGLLLSKYVGALVLVAATTMIFISIMMGLIGLKTGIYKPELLTGGLIMIFSFAIYSSVALLVAIWTRNTALSLISTILLHIVSSVIFAARSTQELTAFIPDSWQAGIDIVYMILPKTSDLETLATQLLGSNVDAISAEISAITVDIPLVMGTSGTFMIVMLVLAAWEFHRRDY